MKKNIVLINRWPAAAGFTNFSDYIDHDEYRVHYIVTESARSAIRAPREKMGSFWIIDNMDFSILVRILNSIVGAHGAIERLIAMAEKDLLVAGQLRDAFLIKGQSLAQARVFIDKGIMKALVEKAGIATPRFKELALGSKGLNFPLILKPKRESSSRGVAKVLSEAELQVKIARLKQEDYLLEEFCADNIYHLDGLVYQGKIVFQTSNQYIGTCLDHALGKSLGSVQVTEPAKNQIFRDFAQQVTRALELKDGAFHLECFLRESTPIFLEIGARAGGGDIREMIYLAHGFNLVKSWIDLQLGKIPQYPSSLSQKRSCGFVIFPGPDQPKTLAHASSFQASLGCVRKEYIFAPGHRFAGSGDVISNSVARFVLVGGEDEIRQAIGSIKSSFQVSYRSELEAAI